MDMKGFSVEDLVGMLRDYHTSSRIILGVVYASAAVQAFDYVLTIGLEVEYIWKARWNLIKGSYIAARWIPWVGMITILNYTNLPGVELDNCRRWTHAIGAIQLAGMYACEVLFIARAAAIWGHRRAVQIGIWAFGYGCLGAAIWAVIKHMHAMNFVRPPVPFVDNCLQLYGGSTNVAAGPWLVLFILDVGILGMLLLKAFKTRETTFSNSNYNALQKAVYRDGIIYYAYLLLLTMTHIVLIYTAPPQYGDLLIPLDVAMYSILTCRAILHIREQSRADTETALPSSERKIPTLHFAHKSSGTTTTGTTATAVSSDY